MELLANIMESIFIRLEVRVQSRRQQSKEIRLQEVEKVRLSMESRSVNRHILYVRRTKSQRLQVMEYIFINLRKVLLVRM